MSERLRSARFMLVALAWLLPVSAQTDPAPERVTFPEAVRRATERNPTVGEAAQAILRAEALLDRAKSVFHPLVYGDVSTTILDAARGFNGNITQPRTQSSFAGTVSYAFLSAERWAAKTQAGDQVGIAKISAEETRRPSWLASTKSGARLPTGVMWSRMPERRRSSVARCMMAWRSAGMRPALAARVAASLSSSDMVYSFVEPSLL